ncbi:hypothetical protein [Algoriphagus sp.]|uniref:hypothetical protein n=1 Tax=Algoriphagus sp. TaxID=1872435 RepID=UPI0032778CBD
MATNKNKIRAGLITQLLFPLILASFSCTHNETLYLSKEFSLPIEITPTKEDYKVGDTLKIDILFPKIIFDRGNNVQYLFENYDFDAFLGIRELKDKSKTLVDQPGANDKFKIINKIGEISPFSQSGNKIFLSFNGTEYKLSSNIILLEPGIYNFIFSTGLSLSNAELINPPSGYEKIIAGVGPTYFIVNRGIDININLLTNNTTTTFDLPDSIDWAKPVFSFQVIE